MMCVCCGKKLPVLYPELPEISEESMVFDEEHRKTRRGCIIINANNRCWNNGIVGIISAGFGSNKDGCEFVIALCDVCLDVKLNNGVVACLDNHIMSDIDVKPFKNEFREIWKKFNL